MHNSPLYYTHTHIYIYIYILYIIKRRIVHVLVRLLQSYKKCTERHTLKLDVTVLG
jgi:hypothetical protein